MLKIDQLIRSRRRSIALVITRDTQLIVPDYRWDEQWLKDNSHRLII